MRNLDDCAPAPLQTTGKAVPSALVTLMGAGPGDPELLTVKALRALQSAELLLHDHLVSDAILELAPQQAERIYVGKESSRHTMPQEEIGALMVRLARQGRRVLRIKGGDGYIFGRGGEEAQVLAAAGIPFTVIPGITAAQGAAAACGIPLTHRDHARSLVLTTGHLQENRQVDLDWQALARPAQTVIIYMGLGTLPIICEQLIAHGLPASTPAALIEKATLPEQRCITGTLGDLPAIAQTAELKPPTLIMIGEVVNLHPVLAGAQWQASLEPIAA
ncbi:MAG: uroporphyrinogen-III C-methyltransferase [Burkholderiales bacterium]|nr:uroporphyrinogen-III C-methyltransferase [Burkholderiales bacterium]